MVLCRRNGNGNSGNDTLKFVSADSLVLAPLVVQTVHSLAIFQRTRKIKRAKRARFHPFYSGVQFSRYSIGTFNDRINMQENITS